MEDTVDIFLALGLFVVDITLWTQPDSDAASPYQPVGSILKVRGSWLNLLIDGARYKQAEERPVIKFAFTYFGREYGRN